MRDTINMGLARDVPFLKKRIAKKKRGRETRTTRIEIKNNVNKVYHDDDKYKKGTKK